MSVDSTLGQLKTTGRLERRIVAEVDRLVATAYDQGHADADVGKALGVPADAIRRRRARSAHLRRSGRAG